MTEPATGLLVARGALDAALDDGRGALPKETGGILLGFRTPDLIVVTRLLTVPDPRSSRHSYRRRRRHAQAQMAAARADGAGAVGYVGEWHTHPADQPPSRTDLRALAATARLAAGPVALLVLAYPAAGPEVLHGLVAVRQPWPIPAISPVDFFADGLTVTDDTAASLEAEAAALLTHTEGTR